MAVQFPRKAFKTLMASILNVPQSYVTWKGDVEPEYMAPTPPLVWASMRIGSSKRMAIGWDDLRATDNGDGSYKLNQVGRRQIVLSMDLFTWSPTDQVFADDLLDDLHSTAWQPINLDVLNGMGLVFEGTSGIIPLPTTIDGRWISAAHLDMTVALATQRVAHVPGGNGWIREVQGTGTVTGEVTETPTYDVRDTVHP